jgi:hypothetical protein
VDGEYLFFTAYMAKRGEKEASDVNGRSRFRLNEYKPNGMIRRDAKELS